MLLITLPSIIEDIRIEFENSDESDYYFYQRIVNYLVKRTEKERVSNNNVLFYGAYTLNLSGKIVKLHFSSGRFTHLTAEQQNLSQTYNKDSFKAF